MILYYITIYIWWVYEGSLVRKVTCSSRAFIKIGMCVKFPMFVLLSAEELGNPHVPTCGSRYRIDCVCQLA